MDLLPSQLSLHVLLVLVLAHDQPPTFRASVLHLLLRELLAPSDPALSLAELADEITHLPGTSSHADQHGMALVNQLHIEVRSPLLSLFLDKPFPFRHARTDTQG